MIVSIKRMDTISPEPELTAQAFYIKRLRFIVDSNSTSDKSRFTLMNPLMIFIKIIKLR